MGETKARKDAEDILAQLSEVSLQKDEPQAPNPDATVVMEIPADPTDLFKGPALEEAAKKDQTMSLDINLTQPPEKS